MPRRALFELRDQHVPSRGVVAHPASLDIEQVPRRDAPCRLEPAFGPRRLARYPSLRMHVHHGQLFGLRGWIRIQVHAVDAAGRVLATRASARDRFIEWCVRLPAGCTVAMEASSSAHHWARELLVLGLDPRIISAQIGLVEPLPQSGHKRQERRQRRCCDLRGRLAPDHALHPGQVRRAAEHAVRAPASRGHQGRPHRVHQPHLGCWPSSDSCSRRALVSCRPS